MHYHGRSIGRLIEYLREYCGTGIADYVMFHGNNEVYLHNKLFATYEWKKNDGVEWPIFQFKTKENYVYNKKQEETLFPRQNNLFWLLDEFQEACHQRDEANKKLKRIHKLLSKIDSESALKMNAESHWAYRLAKRELEEYSSEEKE